MSSPEVIYAWRWLIRDTFRQALANYVFWVLLAASGVVIFFCLSVSIHGGESLRPVDDIEVRRPHGYMTLGFGAWRVDLFRDGESQVRFLLLLLAEWVAGAGGTLLALVWTAGFMPEFLHPTNATVLLAKPVPRWVLLLGKALGVLSLVAFQVAFFILGTWLAVGLRTDFWIASYLRGIPILLLHFFAIYSFSVLLAVLTRSSLICVVGSVAFWFLCWGLNYGRDILMTRDTGVEHPNGFLETIVDIAYVILPKPLDLGMILHNALDAGGSFATMPELEKLQASGAFHPDLAVLTCLGFALGIILLSAYRLARLDY